MMKKWIKRLLLAYVWEKYPREIEARLIEEMLLKIPEKITKPAIELMAKDRALFNRFLYFEASSIFRRDPTDFGNIDRRNGMLILLKAMLLAIATQPDPEVREVGTIGDTLPAPDEWQELAKKGSAAAQEFKKGVKKETE